MQVPLVWRDVGSSRLVNVEAAAAQSCTKGCARGKRVPFSSQVPRSPELVWRSHARLLQSQCRCLCPGGSIEAATGLSAGCKESSYQPSLFLLGVTHLADLPHQGIPVPCSCVARLPGMAGTQCLYVPFRAEEPQRQQGEGRGKIQEAKIRRELYAAPKAIV